MALVERIQAAVARTETLPFKVEIATEAQMDGVIQLRAASYGKHLPELGAKLRKAEAADFELGCEVLVATSKLDGSVLGTLRTHANVMAPLPLEASLKLPTGFSEYAHGGIHTFVHQRQPGFVTCAYRPVQGISQLIASHKTQIG